MPRVIHFEINVGDPERAVEFYRSVFGWKIDRWPPIDYWLITTGADGEPGINGAIKRRSENLTTVNTIGVASVDEYLKKIEQAGGKALTPKMAITGVGYHAYIRDTEGNVVGIIQDDPTAK